MDDHEVVREGLRSALTKDPAVTVVGAAASARVGLALVQRFNPDVVLTDYKLPDRLGDRFCADVLAARPTTRVVILTSFLSEDLVRACRRAGATDVVTKASGLDELRAALARAHTGTPMQESVASTVERLHRSGNQSDLLTPRQAAVLQLASEGFTYAEIGQQLSLSASTVRFHIQTLRTRLGARSKTDLIAIAIRDALVSPREPG